MAKRPIRKIACVGEVMIELIADASGSAQLGVAGDTYNTAVYLNRAMREHAVDVSYVTALGTDPYSARIWRAMEGHGLDMSAVERRNGAMPGLYAIDTDATGERSFSYWRSASAARTLFTPPCDVTLESLERFDLVFLSGITLAILPAGMRRAFLMWAKGFKARGGTLVYDSNHRPRLWEDEASARRIAAEMWALADIALPSVDDEMLLFGDRTHADVLLRLTGLGVKKGALKCGAAGPVNLSNGQRLSGLSGPVRVVDSTAAGDSFNAGYLGAVVLGEPEDRAIRAGHELAVKVIAAKGAILPEN